MQLNGSCGLLLASRGLLQLDNITNLTGPVTIRGKVDYTIKDDDFGDDDVGVLIYVDNMFPPIKFQVVCVWVCTFKCLCLLVDHIKTEQLPVPTVLLCSILHVCKDNPPIRHIVYHYFNRCFLTLLLGFLLIWFIKKKLAYRQFIRVSYCRAPSCVPLFIYAGLS